MSPLGDNSTSATGSTGRAGNKQTSICSFMCSSSSMSSSIVSSTKTPEKSNRDPSYKLSQYKQLPISSYLTPPNTIRSRLPSLPKKPVAAPRSTLPCRNLHASLFAEVQPLSSPGSPSRQIRTHQKQQWKQITITDYFAPRPRAPGPVVDVQTHHHNKSTPAKSRTFCHALLRYNPPRKSVNRIARYTTALPTYDLFDSWGHSLEVIDASTTFRVFLQNPNGFSIYRNNHLLRQDLQICYQYGAAALCFPETNTNWNQDNQVATLQQIFREVWQSSVIQPSQTPDPFLSTYQPGGTLTAICDNWVSRVIARGCDPLGRWSYITLRGKSSAKLTIVTAYNATPTSGDQTYYHQQLRLLSRLHREQNIGSPPDPRKQFIIDLQAWLEFLQRDGHHLIVAMDANSVYDPDQEALQHPLSYHKEKLTTSSTHNGKLATLVSTCQLSLPLAIQHETRPFPASHVAGKNQIDYIFVSKALLPAVQRSGVLSHHSLTRGDHRPYYIDLDAALLFSDPAYQIAPATVRQLQLRDPRKVSKYISTLHELLHQHNVFPRLEALQSTLEHSQWTTASTAEYEALDTVITESMLTAEKTISRRLTTTYQWSPPLKKAVYCLRYWHLRLRQVRGQPVSASQLHLFQREADISPQDQALAVESDVKKAQHQAYSALKELQKRHQELRDTYLENLAEAIVLNRTPQLAESGLEHLLKDKSAKQLKQLISREKMRKMYRKLGRLLNKSKGSGLSRIDIPDAAAVTATSGDPNCPKTWKGPWKSVTNPREIAQEVCKINSAQYHQAHTTPFGSGPLADMIGRRGDTPTSQELLRGTLPPEMPPSLLPETLRVLHSLAQPVPQLGGSAVLTPAEFKATYSVASEQTSSSPSGRHIGHYKAVLQDPQLVQLHSQMMSIPFQVGFAPDRWTKVTDIMLEKEPGNPRCHRLRILALFESDLNHAKRVIIGRRLLHHMHDFGLLPEMQYGSVPGKHCLSAVLKKVLCHDHLRITKRSGAFLENDAIGCYDRLVNNLVLMLLVKLGLPKSVAACIGDLWDNVVHLVKTIYGISTATYSSTASTPLYGPGQGCTCGPLFWLLCYWIIVRSLDPTISAAKFISACRQIIVDLTGVSFVDDSSLATTSEYVVDPSLSVAENRRREVDHLVQRLAALGQHWERLLFTTGGAINFQKSHWYLMTWIWQNGLPRLATTRQAPAALSLTAGLDIHSAVVPRLEPTEGFRTLGVYVTPSGQYTRQAKVLRAQAEQFKSQLLGAPLTPKEAYICLMLYIKPKLTYPFPCVSLTEKQCRYIQAPVLEAILPKLHLNRHSPRAVLFAGPRYGGLRLPEYYTELGYSHLQYLVGHVKLGDNVGQMILSLITQTQLQVGSVMPLFHLPYPEYARWIDSTWITDVWKFTHRAKITVDIEHTWIPTVIRQGDIAIMDLALTFNLDDSQLRSINICRLFLQAITVSDLVTAKGDKLLPSVLSGEKELNRVSHLDWPVIPRPPSSCWRTWRLFLQYFSRGKILHTSLGRWVGTPHFEWRWFRDSHEIVWEYSLETTQWFTYTAELSPLRRTRQTTCLYKEAVPSDVPPFGVLYPVTVVPAAAGYFSIISSSSPFVTPQETPPPNLWQHATIPEALDNTPPFFQHLISTPLTALECRELAQEISEGNLVVCSDGAHDPQRAVASYGTVFGSKLLEHTIASTVGPVDGNPSLVTSYRAELSGIVATLYVIYRVCQFYSVDAGAATVYCDNRGALKNAFTPIKEGITPYFKTDHDLVEVAQSLLHLLPIVITSEWVKGHYNGPDKQYQHKLNEAADKIAGGYQKHQRPHHCLKKPIPPPNYRIRLLHDSSVITSGIKKALELSLHGASIEQHIQTKAKWSRETFLKVHWDAHERAFSRLSRTRQYSTAKLIHNLVNTNKQNSLYYGSTALCPICSEAEESLPHVLTCSHTDAINHREKALGNLKATLQAIATPWPIIDAILCGFSIWTKDPTTTQARAPTAGSLRGPDAILTTAFREQFHEIGWYHMCLGRISKLWASALCQYKHPSPPLDGGLHWVSQSILALWQYSRDLWKFRNEIVHGATVEAQAARRISTLRDTITMHYEAYATHSTIILPRHQFLFESRPLEERVRGSYDAMAAWIRSVEEAISVQQHNTAQQQALAQRFFPSTTGSGRDQTNDSDSSYTYQSSDSVATLSLEPTVATTATTATMSSAASSASVPTYISYGSDDASLGYLLPSDSQSTRTQTTLSSVASSTNVYSNDIDTTSVGSSDSGTASLSFQVFHPSASTGAAHHSVEGDDTSVVSEESDSPSYI